MGGESYGTDTRKACFEAYLTGRDFNDIARSFGPSARTISRWAVEANWEVERERRRTSPIALDQSLLAALALEKPSLESIDGEIRAEAIERCYKIAVIRNKLGTNQVDRGPIAVALVSSFKDHVKAKQEGLVAPEHRAIVTDAIAKLMMGWVSKVLADPEGALG